MTNMVNILPSHSKESKSAHQTQGSYFGLKANVSLVIECTIIAIVDLCYLAMSCKSC